MSKQFNTVFERHLDESFTGFEVSTIVNNTHLFIVFCLNDTDFDIVPDLLPAERFLSKRDIHIGELHAQFSSSQLIEELSDILANMLDGDTAIFFCENESIIEQALTFLEFPIKKEQVTHKLH